MDGNDNTVINRFLIILIGFNLVFLAIFGYFGLWIGQGVDCGYQTATTYDNTQELSPEILNADDEYMYMFYEFEDHDLNKDNNLFEICVSGNVTGNPVLSFQSYNGTVFNLFSMSPTYEKHCFHTKEDVRDQYIGVYCVDCGPLNNIRLYQDITKEQKPLIYGNGGVISTYDYDISIDIYTYNDCGYFLRFMYRTWFFISVGLLIAVGIVVGVNRLEGVFLDD